jgi:hypothetical protein
MKMMCVELEITLRCNRRCHHCNRLVNVYDCQDALHNNSDMSLDQITIFCDHVLNATQKVHRVSVVGGEPLLHPEFPMITEILYERLRSRGVIASLDLTTNGDRIQRISPSILGRYDRIKVDYHKGDFRAFMVAPIDTKQAQKRCTVPIHCGIACNAFGYWPCGPGGAIARLFNLPQYNLHELPQSIWEFEEPNDLQNYKSICNLCQWSARVPLTVSRHPEPSKSFIEAHELYQQSPPKWRKLGDHNAH